MNYWFLYTIATGAIYGSPYLGATDSWNNIPSGCGVIGPIPQSDATATDAYQNPSHYLIQSGILVQVSNIAALQLDAAKSAKKQEISNAVNAKIIAGYQSTVVLASTSKAHFYGTELVDQQNMTASRVYANANPTATISYRPQDATQRVVHTNAEFVQISDAVFARVNGILDQGYTYSNQLAAAQTIAAVQAIVVNVT